MPGDYDGDGKTDLAIFRPSEGNWWILKSAGGSAVVNWGISTDKLVPGDYDGDGKTDITLYRDGGWWKGRFYVAIYTDSEETAKGLAGYALSAVANR